MKINTTRFGTIEIEENKIIFFPLGIPGFDNLKRYALIDYKDPIKWLHAVDDPAVAFIVANPFIIFPDYSVDLRDDEQQFLDIRRPEDSLILTILTVVNKHVTANLKAPLVMNTVNLKGAQIILDNEGYGFRTPLPSEPLKGSGA